MNLWRWLFPRKRKRLDLRLVSYATAEELCARDHECWRVAKEEDTNKALGWVWVERIEMPKP